jgi:hypothetical protein
VPEALQASLAEDDAFGAHWPVEATIYAEGSRHSSLRHLPLLLHQNQIPNSTEFVKPVVPGLAGSRDQYWQSTIVPEFRSGNAPV